MSGPFPNVSAHPKVLLTTPLLDPPLGPTTRDTAATTLLACGPFTVLRLSYTPCPYELLETSNQQAWEGWAHLPPA